MARPSNDLIQVLKTFTPNVYFQPPASIRMKYPCIRVERDRASTKFAGNLPYAVTFGYELMVIDEDPDSVLLHKVVKLPMCEFTRHYVADNLNHDVFKIYF